VEKIIKQATTLTGKISRWELNEQFPALIHILRNAIPALVSLESGNQQTFIYLTAVQRLHQRPGCVLHTFR
jgi:hypothetical protein